MVINWYGEGAFRVQTGALTILTDPFESSTGLTPPRFRADLILKTGLFDSYISSKTQEGQHIIGAGEYEVQGIDVMGYTAGKGCVYVVKTEEIKLGFLGQLATADLSPATLTALRGIDILFVPVGGEPCLDAPSAAKLVKQLEPRIVVPSFYKIPGLKRAAAPVADFEKSFGQHIEEHQEKLTIKAKDIAWEGTKLVVLSV